MSDTLTKTSIHEIHMKVVQKLKERGEEVLQPKHSKPIGNVYGYIKTQIPHKDAGAIFQDSNGTFGLFGDMGALHITGIKWEELGLCDSRCWYEWMNSETNEITFEGDDLHADVHVMCCDKDKFNAHVTIELSMELEKAKELLGMFPEFHTVTVKMVKKEPMYVDREMAEEERTEGEG